MTMTMHTHHDAAADAGLMVVHALILVLVVAYVLAAARREGWSRWRTAGFVSGGSSLLVAFLPVTVAWAHADLRGHMVQHLLIGMFAPLLLTLGAPVTLLLATLPASAARRLVRLLHSRPARLLTHPVSTLVLNTGGMAALYATGLYAQTRTDPLLHVLVHWHFLAAGYLFCWSVAGPDPAPSRPSRRMRGGVLCVGIAGHALLAKLMFVYAWPAGTGAAVEEIQAAAQWMYYGGDIAEMLLVAAFMAAGSGVVASGNARAARTRGLRGKSLSPR